MRYVLLILLALATGTALYFGLTAPLVAPQHRTFDTSAGQVAVARVAGPFAHPWAVAFLAQGAMLEALMAFKRAGCAGVLTYFALDAARLLRG